MVKFNGDKAFCVRRHIGRKHQVEVKDVLARHVMKKPPQKVDIENTASTKDLSPGASVIVAIPTHISPPPPPPPPSPVAQPEFINHMLDKHENEGDNVDHF